MQNFLEELQEGVALFKESPAEPAKIAEVGKALIFRLYGNNKSESLCDMRYQCFVK